VNRVLVLRNGRIEQDGTPGELARQPGYFRDMIESQRGDGDGRTPGEPSP